MPTHRTCAIMPLRTRLLLLALCSTVLGAEEIRGLWDKAELFQQPTVQMGTSTDGPGCTVTTVTISGISYQGAARTFSACLAVPTKLTGKAPAVVLVHGGAGTSFPQWAMQWAEKGYVAIAPDVNFLMDVDHMFIQRNSGTAKDMWAYHAVATVIRSVSVVAAQPQVDASRIAMMGISWGGYLTCIAASLDKRVTVAIPVYGCGFYDEAEIDSGWRGQLADRDMTAFLSPAEQREWIQNFDCKQYLPMMDRPILFATGTSERFFPLNTFEKSIKLPTGPVSSRIIIDWGHDYETPWRAPELIAFADHYVNNGIPLTTFTGAGTTDRTTWTTYVSDVEVKSAGLAYTCEVDKPWKNRRWDVAPTRIDAQAKKITAEIPDGAVAWFINVTDEREYVTSSPLQTSR